MSLILRNTKGTPLTNNEVDGNFTYLEQLIEDGTYYVLGPKQVPGQNGISISVIDDLSPTILTNLPIVTGNFAFGIGNGSEASGDDSVALGNGSKASGTSSLALGLNSVASGTGALALGMDSVASGTSSLALGQLTEASGVSAIAFGTNSKATGSYSVAGGQNGESTATYAESFGSISRNNSEKSKTIGDIGTNIIAQYGTIVGKVRTNDANETKIKFGSNDYAILSGNSSYRLEITVMAIGVNNTKEWKGVSMINNGAFVTATTLIPGIETAGFSAIDVRVDLGTPISPYNILEVKVTGLAATDIKWVTKIDYIDIKE